MVDNSSPNNQGTSAFSATNARSGGFLAVPIKAVRECKSCAQSLAGLLSVMRLDGGTVTYRSREELAGAARVPARTWTRHLAELVRLGLVQQEHTPNATSATKITADSASWFSEGFLPLPHWLIAERIPWAWRIVYAWVVYRAELSLDSATCEDSLSAMSRSLGLTRRSVVNAINGLVDRGLIDRHIIPGAAASRLKMPDSPSEKMARSWCKSGPAPGENLARPTYPKKFLNKNSGQNRADHELSISSGAVPRIANDLFTAARYTGSDGGLLWVVAGAVASGAISEHHAIDAARGAAECRANNRVGYFRTILNRNLRRNGEQLDDILKGIRLTPSTPTDPPVRRASAMARFRSVDSV